MSPPSDDLRHRVDELEATVRGLTQELVEATERIRQLEDTEDSAKQSAGSETNVRSSEQNSGAKFESAVENGTENDSDHDDEPDVKQDDVDDIIVA